MSFGWNCMFRRGAWLEFRRFALLQRKNVDSRIRVINAELSNIGNVKVLYHKPNEAQIPEAIKQARESGAWDISPQFLQVTERRIGLEVDASSSLGKLIMAYIAQGGNPFDISMFLQPDSYELLDIPNGSVVLEDQTILNPSQPYGGVVAQLPQKEEDFKGVETAGWLPLWRYPARKLGGNNQNIYPRADEIGNITTEARKWITQEISQLRNNLEARILKLCDLREQLLLERDEVLKTAIQGVTLYYPDYNPTEALPENHLSKIVSNIDLNFYFPLEDTPTTPDFSKPRTTTKDSYYKSLVDDAPTGEEKYTAIG